MVRTSRRSPIVEVALCMVALLLIGATCHGSKSDTMTSVGPQSPEVGKIAEGMTAPLQTIKTESRAIAKEAPGVAKRADTIDAAASDLTTLQANLRAAKIQIAGAERECDELRGKVGGLEKKRAELQAELEKAIAAKNSTATWMLALLIVVGVAGVPASLFLVRLPSLAIACGAVAVCAIVAQVMIETVREYRVEIGLGLAALLVGGIVWAFVVKARTEKDLTASGEKYKRLLPENLKEQANAEIDKLQSKYTRKVVPVLRRKLGLIKT